MSRQFHLTRTQASFAEDVTTRNCAMFGSIGDGKSLALYAKADSLCRAFPGTVGVLARKDFADLRQSTLRDFWQLWPELRKGYNESTHVLEYPRQQGVASTLIFREWKDLTGILSMNLGFVGLEQAEEDSEGACQTFSGRLRHKAQMRDGVPYHQLNLVGNMAGHNHIWRDYKIKAPREHYDPSMYALYESTLFENKANLPPNYYENLIATMPERWLKRFVYASWDDFEGLIWPEFNALVHVVTPFPIPKDWVRIVCVDFGYRHPTAVLFVAEDPQGNLWLYDEYRCSGTRIEDTCREILARMEAEGVDESRRLKLGDPSMFRNDREDEVGLTSVSEQFASHGLTLQRANNDVNGGIDKVSAYLKSQRLKVFKNCPMTIEEIGDYQWEKLKPGLVGTRPDPEKPRKVKDDLMDAMRYVVNSRAFYNPPGRANERPHESRPVQLGGFKGGADPRRDAGGVVKIGSDVWRK